VTLVRSVQADNTDAMIEAEVAGSSSHPLFSQGPWRHSMAKNDTC